MKTCWLWLLLCAPALAQEPPLVARSLAATCANCHGTDGRARGSLMAPLAGVPAETLLAALAQFRSGERAGTVMPQIVKGYSDAQLRLIAGHFAAQPPMPPAPAPAPRP